MILTRRGGTFLRSDDEDILAACHQERRALVTFDQRTIPDLLRQWAAEDHSHSGVIFGDQDTIKPNRPGAVAAAVAVLVLEFAGVGIVNRVCFLRSAKKDKHNEKTEPMKDHR